MTKSQSKERDLPNLCMIIFEHLFRLDQIQIFIQKGRVTNMIYDSFERGVRRYLRIQSNMYASGMR